MKFHEWKTVYQAARENDDPDALRGSESAWYDSQRTLWETVEAGTFIPELLDGRGGVFSGRDAVTLLRTQIQVATLEHFWYAECRPYYKVYPCIMQSLIGLKLTAITKSLELEDRLFAIRFAEDCEPIADGVRIPSILTAISGGDLFFSSGMEFFGSTSRATALIHFSLNNVSTVDDYLETHNGESLDNETITTAHSLAVKKMSARIALMCHLLADDPSIITPDVLGKDRDRYNNETDEEWKQRAVERAKRRGVVGWNIGADYEVCPHYRRPHFGLRHTGKGRTVPRIVPIKGAVVHRNRLTEVPTGWMTPDGREVEPKC